MKEILNSDEYIVIEFTNENGEKYEVGYPKAAGYTEENLEAELASVNAESQLSSSIYQKINCPPNVPGWVSQGAKKIGIETANLRSDPPPKKIL